jgi:hypothetical protein
MDRGKMTKFELNRLLNFDDNDLMAEIHRVANLLGGSGVLTRINFDRAAKVSSCTIIRRFGSWKKALDAAGVGDLYSGRKVSEKMITQPTKNMTDDELISELISVANKLKVSVLTRKMFDANTQIHSSAIERRFGSWSAGLKKAGLSLSHKGRRYTDTDYFENLLNVWTFYGRQPKFPEMDRGPSRISSGAYENKWGSWGKALHAFIGRVNSDTQDNLDLALPTQVTKQGQNNYKIISERRIRTIALGIRYDVLKRDHFKCVLCGKSPAIDFSCKLHVDHIMPYSSGGVNEIANLRTLCNRCNLGKGNKIE